MHVHHVSVLLFENMVLSVGHSVALLSEANLDPNIEMFSVFLFLLYQICLLNFQDSFPSP